MGLGTAVTNLGFNLSAIIAPNATLALMTAFADSSVNFEVSVWINDPWLSRRALSDLHEAIWWAFKEDAIVIAFPQLDVHFDGALHERPDRFPRAS